MGVYINMEMPTVGRILITLPSGRTLEVSADNTQNILGEAKAVPVPPHGRLIDADALCDLLMNLADNDYTPKVFASYLSYEENAPAIIPASE